MQPLVQGHTAANGKAGLETWVQLKPMTFHFLFIRKGLGEKSSKDPAAPQLQSERANRGGNYKVSELTEEVNANIQLISMVQKDICSTKAALPPSGKRSSKRAKSSLGLPPPAGSRRPWGADE